MGVFKTQLQKAYEFYPLAQIAEAEQRATEMMKVLRKEVMFAANDGKSKLIWNTRASWVPHIEEFAREEELTLEILPDPKQPDINETYYVVTISGWANATSGSQAVNGEGHGQPVQTPPGD